jgi:hypothetical protein
MSKLILENTRTTEKYFSELYNGNYSIQISKYAMKFINDKDKISLADDMNPRIFIAYKLLIKFLESSLHWQKIKNEKLEFTGYDNKIFLDTCEYKNCINIDIKGAYPNALRNINLVDKNTYQVLMSLPKLDRLKAIGMTAKKNMQFDFEDNKIVDYKVNESEYKNCYFSAAKEIEDIMEYIKIEALESFIFTWVDGIYLSESTSIETLNKICLSLREQDYNYHINRVNIAVKRINNILHITTEEQGVKKEFKFKDVYHKKLNNTLTNKYLTLIKNQK